MCQALVEEHCACGHRVACVPCLTRNDPDAVAAARALSWDDEDEEDEKDKEEESETPKEETKNEKDETSTETTEATTETETATTEEKDEEKTTTTKTTTTKITRPKPVKPQRRVLECNDECRQLQRRQALAAALGVSPLRGAPEYGDFLVQYAVSRPTTVRRMEAAFHALLAPGAAPTAALAPMDLVQRRVVHMLAKYYRVASHSEGRFATGRYVVLARGPASAAPRVLLSEVAAVTPPASSRYTAQPSVDGEDPLYVLRLASAAPLDPLAVAAATARHCASCDVVRLDRCNTLVVCKEMATLNAIRLQLLPLGIVVD